MQDPPTGRRPARSGMSICIGYCPASVFIQIPSRGSVQDRNAGIWERNGDRSIAEGRQTIEFGPERNRVRSENLPTRGSTRVLMGVPTPKLETSSDQEMRFVRRGLPTHR